jgi:hypothetical protein
MRPGHPRGVTAADPSRPPAAGTFRPLWRDGAPGVIPAGRRPLTRRRDNINLAAMGLNYEIRVRGRVGEDLADALGLAAEVEPVETVLRGPVQGQEDLHELLAALQDMGLELLEIRRLPPERT